MLLSHANGSSGIAVNTTRLLARQKKNSPIATMIVMHGYGEHIDRYHDVFKHFANQGINVHGWDQRGFGKTGRRQGPLGDSNGLDVLHAEITAASDRIRQPNLPHFIFGHSMGGMNALYYTHVHGKAQKIMGVISSGPALELDPSVAPGFFKYHAASLIEMVLPTMTLATNLSVDKLSHDPKVVEEYKASVYNYDVGSLRLFKHVIDCGRELIRERASTFNIPVHISHGSEDVVTDPKSSEKFFKEIPETTDKSLKIWDGLYHELHAELNKEEVLQTYTEWLLKHVPSQ